VESAEEGVLLRIIAQPGETYTTGDLVAIIGDPGEELPPDE
jgi:pyruvate dehydrogenase E2 component (dihydrolipoamide acetyltransferase)